MENYNKLFLEQLKKLLDLYIVIGKATIESPMWIQYIGLSPDKKYLIFESSQTRHIFFNVPLEEKHMMSFDTNYEKYYEHFRKLKYEFIQSNYPTVYKQVKN